MNENVRTELAVMIHAIVTLLTLTVPYPHIIMYSLMIDLVLLSECSGEIDLVFVLDASGSVRSQRFMRVLDFAIAIVSELEFGDGKTQLGAIKFSDDAELQFNLNQYSSRQDVVAALRKITYMRQRTHTSDALEALVKWILLHATVLYFTH